MVTTPPNANTITPPTSSRPFPWTATKSRLSFEVLDGTMVVEVHLEWCAKLFSENYGVWGQMAPAPLQAGNPVRMTSKILRTQYLDEPYKTILAMAWDNNRLVGYAFARKWKYQDGYVGWVTQLVVDKDSRRQGIGSMILRRFKQMEWHKDVKYMGLVSSHAGACKALCKMYNIRLAEIDLTVIAKHAAGVLAGTTVGCLKNITLHGSLFEQHPVPHTVSLAFTSIWVDHSEPLLAVGVYKQHQEWVLGDLLDGHEFFLLIPTEERPITVPIVPAPVADPF